jgi:uncharacterized protein YbjT (DUF2867 family)
LILVTGATGTTGRELVRMLRDAGSRVRAFVRDAERGRLVLGDGVDLAVGDFDDADALRAAVEGVGRVYVLTPPHPQQAEWERAVVFAARDAGVGHVVKHSLLGAADDSPMQAARQHRASEREVEASGLAFTILRPNFFHQTFAGGMVVQGSMFTAAGDGRVSFVDARDVAAAAVTVLTGDDGHEGRTYVLTGPQSLTFAEAAAVIGEETGRAVQHVDVPAEQLAAGMAQAGVPEWLARDVAALQTVYAGGGGDAVTDDVRTLTGRDPRSLRDFVREHADSF